MKSVLILVLLALLLPACAMPAAQPPSPTPAAVMASFTPTPPPTQTSTPIPPPTETPAPSLTPTPTLHPLAIEAMRRRDYPGSDITIEQTLDPGANYSRYIASYLSDGLKIYALLTVPYGDPPPTGWPVVVFNHGYIPPAQYRTTERYVAYVDAFARNGYIVIKSDYRGHGSSEGQVGGAYSRPDYVVDVLNALASIERFPGADPNRVGMWGHSMGGYITLRAMVIRKDIKAGIIWGGVVASYPDMITRWRATPPATLSAGARNWRSSFIEQYGTFEENPQFWASISANSYLADLSGPLQLDHGEADETVPLLFSQLLYQEAVDAGAQVELYTYPGNDHNISQSFSVAMQRGIDFFDRYVKGP